ncbi:hypothetical protein AM218_15370 [Hymenobacter sp. DG25A]|nr:hypothetical protein AM218_15370 [Hymenobacter sp. DG25A]
MLAGSTLLVPAQVQAQKKAAPTEQPSGLAGTEQADVLREWDKTIAKPVKQAQKTLPSVKKRYAAGLPAGQTLYLTTRLFDSNGQFEQVFVQVTSWQGNEVTGTLANHLELVQQYQPNQAITFPEQAVLDWTITTPDGREEGNFVGKFIDQLQQSSGQ